MNKLFFLICIIYAVGSPQSSKAQSQPENEIEKGYATAKKALGFWSNYPDSLLYYSDEAMTIARISGDKKLLANCYKNYGVYHWVKADHQEALNNYNKALELFKILKEENDIAATLANIGVVYSNISNYEKAYKYFYEALQIAESKEDKNSQARILNSLGVAHKYQKNFREAIRSYRQAASFYRELQMLSGLAGAYTNIGIVFAEELQLDSAIHYHRYALNIFDSLENTKGVINCFNNLAGTFERKKELDSAFVYCSRALELSRKHGFGREEITSMIGLGEVFLIQKKYASAETYFKKSLEMLVVHSEPAKTLQVFRGLANCYREQERFRESSEFLNRLIVLDDSLRSLDLAKQVNNVRVGYELDKKEAELSLLKKDKKISDLRQNAIVLGFSAVIILLGLIMMTQRFSIQRRLKDGLENEVTRRTREINDKNNRLSELNLVNQKLFSIISHDLRSPLNTLTGMLQAIRNEYVDETEFRKFSLAMEHQVKETAYLMENLLQWAKEQVSGTKETPSKFFISALVKENCELLKNEFENKRIQVLTFCALEASAMSSVNEINTVIRNLMVNAIKFTNPGGVVSVICREERDVIIVSVKDSGIGIDMERKQNLFKPFLTSSPGTLNERGAGLGLMLCKEFIEKNGGDIWVESEPGSGSTFSFSVKKCN